MGLLTSGKPPLDWQIASSRDTDLHHKGSSEVTELIALVVSFVIPLGLIVAYTVGLLFS